MIILSLTAILTCPENISTIADPFSETATVTWPRIGAGLTTTPANGTAFAQGVTPVSVDGRSDECTFYVHVEGKSVMHSLYFSHSLKRCKVSGEHVGAKYRDVMWSHFSLISKPFDIIKSG